MTERPCVTEGCNNPAIGTGWFSHLCSECDIKRIARVEASLLRLKMAPKVVVVICRKAVDGQFHDSFAHVATSWEKAEMWIKKNPHWGNTTLWWWVGYEVPLDDEWGWSGNYRNFDKDGYEHRTQGSLVPDHLIHLTPWGRESPKHWTLWERSPHESKHR